MLWILAAGVVLLAALNAVKDHAHDRATRALVTGLASQITAERDAFIQQIDRLCQRIQAPEQAVVDHTVTTALPSLPAVPVDDDKAWWASRDIPKEQLAEMLDDLEHIA